MVQWQSEQEGQGPAYIIQDFHNPSEGNFPTYIDLKDHIFPLISEARSLLFKVLISGNS